MPFHASAEATATVIFGDESKLSCKGFKLDTIDGLGCVCWNSDESNHDIVQPHRNHPAIDKEPFDAAIWRTLVANRDPWGEPAPDWYQNLVKILWRPQSLPDRILDSLSYDLFNRFPDCNKSMQFFGHDFQTYFPEESATTADPSVTWTKFHEALRRLVSVQVGRRLLTTAEGYIGLASEMAQRGDIICILLGCSVPVALRPVGEHYKLVGECYIHGLMEGEAMKWLDRGDYMLEDITLC
ncbi:hypothetical protein MMC16_007765 [Acarospora aff. strigata]|nr:hypothetical protein [Acarospora aff. strigata]